MKCGEWDMSSNKYYELHGLSVDAFVAKLIICGNVVNGTLALRITLYYQLHEADN